MSGLFAGRIQLWGVRDRVIPAAGGKARPRPCVQGLGAGGWRTEPGGPSAGGHFPCLASLPLMELGYPKK